MLNCWPPKACGSISLPMESRHCRDRLRGQPHHPEHWRPPAAYDPGAGGGGGQLRRPGPEEEEGRDRRRLRPRPSKRHLGERRFEQVYFVARRLDRKTAVRSGKSVNSPSTSAFTRKISRRSSKLLA